MIISRFLCKTYLFGGESHCSKQCDECLSVSVKEKPVSNLNEEKSPMYFVWERVTTGTGARYQAARYREMPMTGTGSAADNKRFVRVQKLEGEEANISTPMITLINKYPCPNIDPKTGEPTSYAPVPEPKVPRV